MNGWCTAAFPGGHLLNRKLGFSFIGKNVPLSGAIFFWGSDIELKKSRKMMWGDSNISIALGGLA